VAGYVAGGWELSRVISHGPQICSLLKLGFPDTQVGYHTNHTDCHRTGDNLLLNAERNLRGCGSQQGSGSPIATIGKSNLHLIITTNK